MDESREPITGVSTDAREEREDVNYSRDTCDDVEHKTNSTIRPPRLRKTRVIQDFILVWLDSNIEETNDKNCDSVVKELQQLVSTVETFTDADECIDFITDIKEEKIFLILSERFVQTIVPIVDEIPQVTYIYIFPGDRTQHEEWAKPWRKISGVFADISSIREELKRATEECNQNFISVSFVPSSYGTTNRNLDELDSSFMYTQILKEILLTIDFNQGHIKEFVTYCREQFVDDTVELKKVDIFEKDYHCHQSIWWYTYPCFLYSMLNRALRTMEVQLITKMGFIVRDLHEHIAALHSEQFYGHHHSGSFTVYRGQGLSQADFDQLQTTQGGLLAFNNFLSTTLNRAISLAFAESIANNPDLIGIHFEINIDPSISSTLFANVKNVSYFQEEEEILFSMHSVFRIGQVKQIEKNNNRLWQVDLTLTGDHDPQLQELTKSMQDETEGPTGWFRLGRLMMKVAQFDKAQQVFEMILDRTTDEKEKGHIYHDLGLIKMNQGKYTEAMTYMEKSLKIRQKTLPANHFTFSTSRDNSDLMNVTTHDCRSAIASFEEAAEMLKQTLPEDDPSLAEFYDRCGSACQKMGNDEEALSFYDHALRLREIQLPPNHPSLAASYANYGDIHESMGDSSTAHSYHQRALNIGQRSLPANHPDLQTYRARVENEAQGS